jgi:hypothetical protein
MKPSPVEEHLEDIRLADEDRFTLVQSLRKLVLSVHPSITEEVKYGGLLFTAASPFCGVFSYTRHVSLEFSRGADLADPHKVLEGDGAKRRHIKITTRGDVFKKNVREYVELALAATPGKAAHGKAPRRTPTR